MIPPAFAGAGESGGASIAWGLGLAFAGALLVVVTRQGSWQGALAGWLAAAPLVLGLGAAALAPLALFVIGSGLLTRVGRATKERLGSAEPNRGRRGPAHAAAKLGLPAVLGLLAAFRPDLRTPLAVAAVAAIAAAFADTAATEVGPLLGGPVARLKGVRVVRASHGSPGGVSAGGVAAAAGAALATAALATAVGLAEPSLAVVVFACGLAATLLESAVGGMEIGQRLGHFGRNALLSVVAAASAWTAAMAMGPR